MPPSSLSQCLSLPATLPLSSTTMLAGTCHFITDDAYPHPLYILVLISGVHEAQPSEPPLSAHGGSPAADPIPYSVVQRIRSGHFVEMCNLLADNIALLNQLSTLQGSVALPKSVVTRKRLREILSFVCWLYCLDAYIAVHTSDPLARDMLAYSRLLIREALQHEGSGWLECDRVFHCQLAINPCYLGTL